MMLLDLPVVRAARRDRVPLRRPGPRGLPRGPERPDATRSGPSTCSSATTPRARSPSGGRTAAAAAVVQRRPRHRDLRGPRGLHRTPTRARPSPAAVAPRSRRPPMTAAPPLPPPRHDRRPHRPRSALLTLHRRRRSSTSDTPATRSPPRCSPTAGSASATPSTAGRPRGIMAAGVEEPNALLQIDGRPLASRCCPPPPCRSSTALRRPPCPGSASSTPTPTTPIYDKKYVHTDVLVIGGGPAGLAAARQRPSPAPASCSSTTSSELGGSLLSGPSPSRSTGKPARDWVAAVAAELAAAREVTVLPRTTAFGVYDDNYVLAVQNRTDHLDEPGPGRRLPAAALAHPGPPGRPGHRRPRAPAGLRGQRPPRRDARRAPSAPTSTATPCRPGDRAVVATTNDSAYDTVADLVAAGVEVAAVVDARAALSGRAAEIASRGIRVAPSSTVQDTDGDERTGRLTRRHVGSIDDDGELTCGTSARLRPAGRLRRLEPGGAPAQPAPGQAALGRRAGRLRARRRGQEPAGRRLRPRHLRPRRLPRPRARSPVPRPPPRPASSDEAAQRRRLRAVRRRRRRCASSGWCPVGTGEPGDWDEHFVDLQRDQTVADVLAGHRCRHAHRRARQALHLDQHRARPGQDLRRQRHRRDRRRARTAAGSVEHRHHHLPRAVHAGGVRRPRRTRARRAVRPRARPRRCTRGTSRTAPSSRIVGQWKRPWYYPQAGEDMDAAVARECRGRPRPAWPSWTPSTLGKIEIRGADAGEFLNRIYTNAFKKLPVGSARYGVMCRPRRHDLRRRRHAAPGRRPLLHDHHHRRRRRRSSTGSRSGCRPSGRSSTSTAPR